MRIETNTQHAIAGRTAAPKAGTAGTGPGQEQGQSDGVDLGLSGAVFNGKRYYGAASLTPPHWAMPRQNSDIYFLRKTAQKEQNR